VILAIVVAAALGAGGPCALPQPAAAPDVAAAREYLEVGDAELASGSPQTATVAYRESVRLDPSNRRARESYLAACAQEAPASDLADGRRGSSESGELVHGPALRTRRGLLSLSADSGYDSNLSYAPAGAPASADGGSGLGGSLVLRPLGLSGPYLRANGWYRGQFRLHDRDAGLAAGQVGWRAGEGASYAFADYGFDTSFLGGAPYLVAHRLRGGGRWQVQRVALSLVYAARFGSYQTPSAAPFSGVYQLLDPEISLRFPMGSSLALAYHAGRDSTDSPDFSSWDHGPRAVGRLALSPTLRATLEASFVWRRFDPAGGSSGTGAAVPDPRADRILFVGGAVEKDFANGFALRFSAGDRQTWSNLPGVSYSRVTAILALTYSLGFL
jgi:hypothetical protein